MNKRQKAKRNAYAKLESVLSENKSIIKGYGALENNVATFEKIVADIDATNELSVGGRGRGNQTKNQAHENLVAHIVAVSKKAWTWADEAKKPALVDFFEVVKTDFEGKASSEIVALCENLIKGLTQNLAELAAYRVSEKNITEAQQLLVEYKKEIPEPTLKVKKTAEANKKLVKLFEEADKTILKIGKLIEGEYYQSHAEFVSLVQSARAIDEIGSRGTKVTMYITDAAGKPIADVLGDILEMTDEEQYSNADGEIQFEEMKSGDYTYQLSHNDKKHNGKFSLKTGEQLKVKVVF